MRLRTCCACVIAMCLVSMVASGEILEDSDYYLQGNATGNEYVGSATAYADGDDYHDYGLAEGEQFTYTTESENNLDWYYYVYAWAEGEVFLHDYDEGGVQSYAYVYGECKHWDPPDANEAEVDEWRQASGHYMHVRWTDGAYTDLREGNGYYSFDAGEGVDCEHAAFTQAQVTSGGDSVAFGHACTRAWGNLWVYP